MADKGHVVSAHSSIADTAYLDIQPGSGEEWLVANIYAGGAAELYRTDGTHEIKIDDITEAGSWSNYKFFLTNGTYFRVKNVSGDAVYIGYDGVRVI